jgi:hypothetical protein
MLFLIKYCLCRGAPVGHGADGIDAVALFGGTLTMMLPVLLLQVHPC